MGMRPELTGARILVVDDDPTGLGLLTQLLTSAGATAVRATQDPREGLELFASHAPDLVLLDLHMPHLDGFRVLETLTARSLATFIPVLVITADITPQARHRALALASGLLTKPFDPDQLLEEVTSLLRLRRRLEVLARDHAADPRPDHALTAAERDTARARVRDVLDRQALACAYQPIVELPGGLLLGVEALARFPDTTHRGPAPWFADAARAGLSVELETLAVRTALPALTHLPGDAFLAINLSPAGLSAPDLGSLLAPHAERVVLELTETQPVEDYTTLGQRLDQLRSTGVRFAVDDAGAGYASLRHILRLAPDMIKLDVSITRDVDTDPVRHALTAALTTFATDINAQLVAEGIETPAELAALTALGVRAGQGFYLGRPGPLPPRHGPDADAASASE